MKLKRIFSVTLFAFVLAFSAFGQTVVVPSANVIQYTNDFTALTYLDAKGATVTVSFMDGQRFSDLVGIRGDQVQAAVENTNASNNYNQSVQNAQISVNAGRPTPDLPTKPQQKVVSNTGVVTYVDFAPPLLSIVPLVTAPHINSIRSEVTTPDPVVQQSAQLTVILNQLSAIISALRTKGIM